MCPLCRSGCIYFLLSRRRRHTRCLSDWSSDVCSSDLVVFTASLGHFNVPLLLIWSAALIGLMLESPGTLQWSFPRRWAFPLILWALTVACVWPLVVLREYDDAPLLLGH